MKLILPTNNTDLFNLLQRRWNHEEEHRRVEEVDNTKQFAAPWVKMLVMHLHFFHFSLLLLPYL